MIIQSDSVHLNARRALVAGLHAGELGTFESILKDLSKYSKKDKTVVCLATINTIDVGVCVMDGEGHIGIFVKPEYRGNRIGEKLVHATLEKSKRTHLTCYASIGNKEHESMQFWKRLNIFVDEHQSADLHGNTDGYPHYSINALRDSLRFSLIAQGFPSRHYLWNYF
jgi:GNAT superfamily N-acetyltransferase